MKLRKLRISSFLSANLTMGFSTFTRFITGLIKTKFAAVILGTAGVGLVGLGGQIRLLGITLGSLSIGAGFTRRLSAHSTQADEGVRRELLATTFALIVSLNVVLIVICAIFSKPISRWAFGGVAGARYYLIPILVSIFFQSLIGSYLNGVFFARSRLRLLTQASIIGALVEAGAYLLLIHEFGTVGAFWAIALGFATWVILLFVYSRKFEKITDVLPFARARLNRKIAQGLVVDGLIMSAGGTLSYLTVTVIRVRIIQKLGAPANGLYQVALAFTAYYIPYLTNGIWAELFPKVSAESITPSTFADWSEAIRTVAVLAAAIQIALLIAPGTLIHLAYASPFLGSLPIIPIQLLGDFFFLIAQPSIGVTLGLSKFKLYLLLWSVYHLALYVLTLALMRSHGLVGVCLAYLFCNVGFAAYGIGFYFRYAIDAKKTNEAFSTILIIALAGILVSLQVHLFVSGTSGIARASVLLAWGFFVVSAFYFLQERESLKKGGYLQ